MLSTYLLPIFIGARPLAYMHLALILALAFDQKKNFSVESWSLDEVKGD